MLACDNAVEHDVAAGEIVRSGGSIHILKDPIVVFLVVVDLGVLNRKAEIILVSLHFPEKKLDEILTHKMVV